MPHHLSVPLHLLSTNKLIQGRANQYLVNKCHEVSTSKEKIKSPLTRNSESRGRGKHTNGYLQHSNRGKLMDREEQVVHLSLVGRGGEFQAAL